VTPDFFRENGFKVPILVEKTDGLNLKLPPASISIEEIERRVGKYPKEIKINKFGDLYSTYAALSGGSRR
jgi:hypothetical protein